MIYILYGALLFWALFFASQTEAVVVALIIFAICCAVMLRMEVKKS